VGVFCCKNAARSTLDDVCHNSADMFVVSIA